MNDFFYRAFEEKHRGSRDLIKSRLSVYLPFVRLVFESYPESQALDLGCGRGEWLELLRTHGFAAQGVDLEDGMLQACRERDLYVETADALDYLERQPSGSFCVVSGFHIAEHLPFEVLQKVVLEVKRVLLPGGLLILETPNPENISVGTSNFYLDPTHERPIPPELLSFLAEFYGFERHKVLRLQESAQLHHEMNPRLIDVLAGVSPDYALVAQTEGAGALLESLKPLFEKDYGLTLHSLAEKFQLAFEQRLLSVAANAEQAAIKAEQAEANMQQYALQLAAVYNSRSWSTTAPLRWVMFQLRLLNQHGFRVRVRALACKMLHGTIRFSQSHPRFKRLGMRLVLSLGLHAPLQRMYQGMRGSVSMQPHYTQRLYAITELQHLNPRAREIHADLKSAMGQHQQEGR